MYVRLEVQLCAFLTLERWAVSFTPRPLYLPGVSLGYPLIRRFGGPQSRRELILRVERQGSCPSWESNSYCQVFKKDLQSWASVMGVVRYQEACDKVGNVSITLLVSNILVRSLYWYSLNVCSILRDRTRLYPNQTIVVSVLMFRIFTEDKGRMCNDANKYHLNEDAVKNSYTLQVAWTCETT